MQKLTAILFSFLILFQSSNISLEDFSKFKVLLEHAQFHQDTYGDSFLEFIVEHYGDLNNTDSIEHEEHEDLPFKNSQQSCSQINSAFVLNYYSFSVQHQYFNEVPRNFLYKESHSIFEKIPLLQPPKAA